MLAYDVIIIGGGVAGLWTLNRLRSLGYHAILLEKQALGFGQTIASQGIIHGGIKYSLQGALSRSSQEISDMPARWHSCLQQQGEIDLRAVNILSSYYYLCSQQAITQSITQFFAQKALRSHSASLEKNTYPDFFNSPAFTGRLTQVDEVVLDVPSLLTELARPLWPFIVKVEEIQLQANHCVQITGKDKSSLTLMAKKIVLTAGEGNAQLLAAITQQTLMQKRPLHMVMLTADNLPALFVHCIGLNTNPVLTITSHTTMDGKTIWYLGGQLAEEGVAKDEAAQMQAAAALLAQQFPWFRPINPQWKSLRIDRCEGFNQGVRPESVTLQTQGDIIAAWPTKLTFAPLLADKVIACLPKPMNDAASDALSTWPKPTIAKSPWH